jgi:hypothetical protein
MNMPLFYYSQIVLMKLTTLLRLALLLPAIGRSGKSEATEGTSPATNAIVSRVAPEAWLHLPSRELVLDVQHETLEYGARLDASEFLASVLNVLLAANYKVRLSDEFIQGEIRYYRENLSQEAPVEMSRAILSCLERARASGALEWDCFKGDFNRTAEPTVAERHLPWLAPPFKANLVSLAGAGGTNLSCLHLSLKWTGRSYGGAVQHSRRPGGLPGETVLLEGKNKLWAFAAEMRLTKGGQTLFEKVYPREEWQGTYLTIYEQPLWKTSQAILQDLASGLRAKTGSAGEAGRKKPRGHPQGPSGLNSAESSP